MYTDLKIDYPERFFKNRYRLAWRVPIFVKAVLQGAGPFFPIRTAIDIGCANGDLVKGFSDAGISTMGVEGSISARPYLLCNQNSVVFKDIRRPIAFDIMFDLALCLEVIEHIEPEYAESAVYNICQLSDKILLSAAPPGQKGYRHHNCQEIEYWDGIFNANSFIRNDSVSDEVKRILAPYRHKQGIKAYYNNLHFYEKRIS